MSKCKECKWWAPWVAHIKEWKGSGTCYNSKAAELANQGRALLKSDHPSFEPWEPLADFGCNQFEKNESGD